MEKRRYELYVFRKKHGLTQAEMAEKIGVARTHYCAIESGRHNPTTRVLDGFREAFRDENPDVLGLFKLE